MDADALRGDPRRQAGHRVRRPRQPEAGEVDRPSRSRGRRSGLHRCRRQPRLPHRRHPSRAGVDAALRARVAAPHGVRAADVSPVATPATSGCSCRRCCARRGGAGAAGRPSLRSLDTASRRPVGDRLLGPAPIATPEPAVLATATTAPSCVVDVSGAGRLDNVTMSMLAGLVRLGRRSGCDVRFVGLDADASAAARARAAVDALLDRGISTSTDHLTAVTFRPVAASRAPDFGRSGDRPRPTDGGAHPPDRRHQLAARGHHPAGDAQRARGVLPAARPPPAPADPHARPRRGVGRSTRTRVLPLPSGRSA